MQKDTLHVFVVVRMSMSMIVSFVSVVMTMAVMRVAEGYKADDVNDETKDADYQKLV
jgi:hypothetical protein